MGALEARICRRRIFKHINLYGAFCESVWIFEGRGYLSVSGETVSFEGW